MTPMLTPSTRTWTLALVAVVCVALGTLCLLLAHVGGSSYSTLHWVEIAAFGGSCGLAYMLVATRVRDARQRR
jgi:hypothetical protein